MGDRHQNTANAHPLFFTYYLIQREVDFLNEHVYFVCSKIPEKIQSLLLRYFLSSPEKIHSQFQHPTKAMTGRSPPKQQSGHHQCYKLTHLLRRVPKDQFKTNRSIAIEIAVKEWWGCLDPRNYHQHVR